MTAFEQEDRSVVEFQLGNKQLFMLFVGLLVICAIFFFIGLRVGEDTARSRVPFDLAENNGGESISAANTIQPSGEQTPQSQPLTQPITREKVTEKPAQQPKRTENSAAKKNTDKPKAERRNERKKENDTPKRTEPVTTVAGGLYVQVAAQTSLEAAEKVRSRLPKTMNTIVEKAVVKGKDYFRVLIGPYSTKDKAEQARQVVLSSYKGAFIRPN